MDEITSKALNTISFTAGVTVPQSLVRKQQLEGDEFCLPGEGSRSLLILLNFGIWRPEGVAATEKFVQELLKSDYVHHYAIDTINV